MSADYMPKSFGNLLQWLTGLKTGVTTDGPTCGQSAAQVTTDTALIDSILTPVGDAMTKETAWLEANGTARATIRTKDSALRDMINRYKAATGWTDGMADAWAVKTHQSTYDMSTHKPTITALAMAGWNEIRGKKPGFTSVSIQMRPDGTTDWTMIGMKINHFPFYDTTVAQTPGKPEKRQYQALGYDGDTQVGQPSDIVTAVFSG